MERKEKNMELIITQRKRQRQTNRQTDRDMTKTKTETDRQTDRQTEAETERDRIRYKSTKYQHGKYSIEKWKGKKRTWN